MGKVLDYLRQEIREEDASFDELEADEPQPLTEMLAAEDLTSVPNAEGADQLRQSLHAYTCTGHFMALMGTLLSEYPYPPLEAFDKTNSFAESEFMPEGPPISPVTSEFFKETYLLDREVDAGEGSLADLVYGLANELSLSTEVRVLVDIMRKSRLGLYVQTGHVGHVVLVREVLTNKSYQLLTVDKVSSNIGDIWFTRLLPCVDDQHKVLVKDKPYIIRGTTEEQWISYLSRMGIQSDQPDLEKKLDDLFKRPKDPHYWLSYLVHAFGDGSHPEAIYLTGIPDLAETLPHMDPCSIHG